MLCVIALFSALPLAQAKGRYAELIMDFGSKRQIRYHANQVANAIILELAGTAPEELAALNHYDERLIKRVLITDLGPAGSEVKLFLQDRNVRATVDVFEEPFRLRLTFFDKDYSQDKDPQTSLPLASLGGTEHTSSAPGKPGKLLSSEESAPFASASPLASSEAVGSSPEALPSAKASPGRRRLLQPTPEIVNQPGELSALMHRTPAGRGKAWSEYPIYVYPLQTAAYQEKKEPRGWSEKASQEALSSSEAMAAFALKLYTFGHEGRSLVAYQQVLYTDSSVFNKDPLHLWAFAEAHFGQGNLTLANGYYQTLLNKFPESPLAKFAAVRRLDIQAIKRLGNRQFKQLPGLLSELVGIDPSQSGEILGLIAIRKAYWQDKALDHRNDLPVVNNDVQASLEASYGRLESQRTSFIVTSLLLQNRLQPQTPWSRSTGQFAGAYFTNYTPASAQPFYAPLKKTLEQRLSHMLQQKGQEGHYADAVAIYEALPKALKDISRFPAIAWALAESYRNIAQDEHALSFYKTASTKISAGPKRFKSYFWLAFLASRLAQQSQQAHPATRRSYRQQSEAADRSMQLVWDELKEDEKRALQTTYKEHFEASLHDPSRLRTPAKIMLASWTSALSTQINTPPPTPASDWNQLFSPTGATVRLLRDLARHFSKLGLQAERRQTIQLLKEIQPANFQADQEARKIWSQQLIKLAEEYRKSNDYLEAGRLYAFTAENSQDWENRTESLYKGGLLLYRAGKREEAIKAFTAASQDSNNLFYANLAKERLTQLLP